MMTPSVQLGPTPSSPTVPVHSVVADEECLPFGDSSFDLVMSSLRCAGHLTPLVCVLVVSLCSPQSPLGQRPPWSTEGYCL